MHRGKLFGCVAALVAAGFLGTAIPGSAQKNGKGAKTDASVGYVDLAQVTEKIKDTDEWKVNIQKFEAERGKKRNEIENLAKIRFLSKAERDELSNLQAKNKPTDGEKNRIKDLEEKSTKLDQEYQKLAMTEKPNETESKRLQELTTLREKASGDLQEEYDRRAADLQKMEAQMLDDMQQKILKIVGQVSEKQNLALVVDRQAILFGGQDITKDVLEKLPK